MSQKRPRKAGNLEDLQRVLWRTVIEVEGLLDTRPPSNELVLRAAHALAQVASTYAKIHYDTEIDRRLTALEAADHERNGHYG